MGGVRKIAHFQTHESRQEYKNTGAQVIKDLGAAWRRLIQTKGWEFNIVWWDFLMIELALDVVF